MGWDGFFLWCLSNHNWLSEGKIPGKGKVSVDASVGVGTGKGTALA